jgi:hypothetical protein
MENFLITDQDLELLGKINLSNNMMTWESELKTFFNDLMNDTRNFDTLEKFGILFPRFRNKIKNIDIWNKREIDIQFHALTKGNMTLTILGDDGSIVFEIIHFNNILDLNKLNNNI